MANLTETNIWITIAAIIGTGIMTWIVGRVSKNYDARGAAEAALIGTGPAIIKHQNDRIASLQREIDSLWKRDRECQDELAECHKSTRRMDTELLSFQQRLRFLEKQLGNEPEGTEGC